MRGKMSEVGVVMNQTDKTTGIRINQVDESGLAVEDVGIQTNNEPRRSTTGGAAAKPEKEKPRWVPSRERVEAWAVARSLNHYDVLEVDQSTDDAVIEERNVALDRSLERWAMDMMDANAQRIGNRGKDRLFDLKEALKDRASYNLELQLEKQQSSLRSVREVIEQCLKDQSLQWNEWKFIVLPKAEEEGITREEVEVIMDEMRARGALTGLRISDREVRTILELKDLCQGEASGIVDVIWNGELEVWLEQGAARKDLADEVRRVKEEYEDTRLSGAHRILWRMNERRLVLTGKGGQESLSSVQAWLEGVSARGLESPSLEALKDRRLEDWFYSAMGREDLGKLAQQLRDEEEQDLSKILRAIKAEETDAIFEWRDGTAAYSLAELAVQCDKNLDEAKTYLLNKSFERRLQELGKAPLATAASTLRSKYKDAPLHGVEVFTRELCKTAKINPYPILAVQQDLGFGKVRFGETQVKSIQIENRGRGNAWGTIKLRDTLPGLTVPDSFDLEGNTRDIEIKLDTSNADLGQYSTELTIQGDGLPEPYCISISYEVVRLDLAIDRASMDMGRVPIGGKVRETVTITNNGRGRSLGGIKLEPALPGVTFPQQFLINSGEVVEIDVDVDTVFIAPRRYAADLVITGDGFGDAFEVPLSFEVAPLEVKFDPPVVKLGKIMHGTKSKATLRVSCTPEGGRLIGKPSGIKPSCIGLAVQGQLEGQHSEFEIQVDTSKLEPGKRFNINLLFDTNVNTLEVPIEFRTSMRPNQVIAGRTIAFGLGTGIVMYVCRALLQNVDSLNQWFYGYGSDISVIIATGAFGALVAAVALFASRRFSLVTAIGRRLRSNSVKAKRLVKDLDEGESVTSLGLDVVQETSGVKEELRTKRRGAGSPVKHTGVGGVPDSTGRSSHYE
jgi:hypothetical protein